MAVDSVLALIRANEICCFPYVNGCPVEIIVMLCVYAAVEALFFSGLWILVPSSRVFGVLGPRLL